MKRPSHATDCLACDGWIGGAELLCVQCTNRVQKHMPDVYPAWLKARASKTWELEAYYRGFIVGTAKVLYEKRWQPAGKKGAHS